LIGSIPLLKGRLGGGGGGGSGGGDFDGVLGGSFAMFLLSLAGAIPIGIGSCGGVAKCEKYPTTIRHL